MTTYKIIGIKKIMKESKEMIKTGFVILLGIVFYMYVMSNKTWRDEIIRERIINHPERKFIKKW